MTAILDILRSRQEADISRLLHDHAHLSKDVGGLAFYTDSRAILNKADESSMISWWRIATMAMDRDGDVLVTSG